MLQRYVACSKLRPPAVGDVISEAWEASTMGVPLKNMYCKSRRHTREGGSCNGLIQNPHNVVPHHPLQDFPQGELVVSMVPFVSCKSE